jgi:hypothetical protein
MTFSGGYIKVPTTVRYMNKENFTECRELSATLLTAAYPNFGKIAALRRNPQLVFCNTRLCLPYWTRIH